MSKYFATIAGEKKSPSDSMRELREQLPEDWLERFVELFPECDTVQWGIRLREAILLRSNDIDVQFKLRELISSYESQKKAS